MDTSAIPKKWRKLKIAALAVALVTVGLWAFVKLNPMIFNESFVEHMHCISQAGLALRMYANDHEGRFPSHTNGFGDALLPLIGTSGAYPFTGPMFDSSELIAAQAAGRDVDESKLGRIYVQGLTETNNPAIAIMFDQLATPGGDHCHFVRRILAPYGREIGLVDGTHDYLEATDWHAFATNQIELLVAAGVERKRAQHYYEMTGLKFEE